MQLKNNTVLITGGNSGIGLALALRFLRDGNRVLICGKDPVKLAAVQAANPGLETVLCDVSREEDRIRLFETVRDQYPETNILINNAGIQQVLDVTQMDWAAWRKELDTDLLAPVHLSGLFIPFLTGKENAWIVNVSSGLAFFPPIRKPVYGAAKSGLHAFTFTMRQQLVDTGVGVVEIIPPAVNTNLGGAGVHAAGADVDEFADSVYADLGRGAEEIFFGFGAKNADRTRRELEAGAIAADKR